MDRILVSVGDGVGNVVMSTPMISALATMYRVDILASCNYTDGWKILENRSEIQNIYSSENDIEFENYRYIASTIGGVKNISLSPIMSTIINMGSYFVTPSNYYLKSEIENNMDLARELGYKGSTPHTFCSYLKDWLRKADIVLHNGNPNHETWKRKSFLHFVQLVRLVKQKYPDAKIAIVGTEKNEEPFECGVVDWTHANLSILETASIIAYAKMFITVDSGLAHIACALKTPTYIIWGPTSLLKNKPPDAHVILPKCTPCQEFYGSWERVGRWGSCTDWKCMQHKPEDIIENLTDLPAGR